VPSPNRTFRKEPPFPPRERQIVKKPRFLVSRQPPHPLSPFRRKISHSSTRLEGGLFDRSCAAAHRRGRMAGPAPPFPPCVSSPFSHGLPPMISLRTVRGVSRRNPASSQQAVPSRRVSFPFFQASPFNFGPNIPFPLLPAPPVERPRAYWEAALFSLSTRPNLNLTFHPPLSCGTLARAEISHPFWAFFLKNFFFLCRNNPKTALRSF